MTEIWSSPVYPEAIQIEAACLELLCSASIFIVMTASYVSVQEQFMFRALTPTPKVYLVM